MTTLSEAEEFARLIELIRKKAEGRKFNGDRTSLLRQAQAYEKAYNEGCFNLDYIHNFYHIFVENKKLPDNLIPVIFGELKRLTGLNIDSYNRDELRDSNLNSLKSCKIYNNVFAKFKYFTFIKSHDNSRVIPSSLNQRNEEFDMSAELESFIATQWENIESNQEAVQRAIFAKLLESDEKISDAVMFEFENQIFIMPFKKIQYKNKKHEILKTHAINIPGSSEEVISLYSETDLSDSTTNNDMIFSDPNTPFDYDYPPLDVFSFFEMC